MTAHNVVDLGRVRRARGLPPVPADLPPSPFHPGQRVRDCIGGRIGTVLELRRGPSGALAFLIVAFDGWRRVMPPARLAALDAAAVIPIRPPRPRERADQAGIRPKAILFDDVASDGWDDFPGGGLSA